MNLLHNFYIIILWLLPKFLSSTENNSQGICQLPSGLVVSANNAKIFFRLANESRLPANASALKLKFRMSGCKTSESVRFNNKSSDKDLTNSEASLYAVTKCVWTKLCYSVPDDDDGKLVQRCEPDEPEVVDVESIYIPPKPKIETLPTARSVQIHVSLDVEDDYLKFSTTPNIFTCEVQLLCESGCGRSQVAKRISERCTDTVKFDNLNDNSSYLVTAVVLMKSGLRSKPVFNHFKTPLGPPKGNPYVIGYERSNFSVRLVVAQWQWQSTSLDNYQLSLYMCHSNKSDASDKQMSSRVFCGMFERQRTQTVSGDETIINLRQLLPENTYKVELLAYNSAGTSQAKANQIIINSYPSNYSQLFVRATVDEFVTINVQYTTALYFSATVYVGTVHLTVGFYWNDVDALMSTNITYNENFYGYGDEISSLDVVLDWVRCESDLTDHQSNSHQCSVVLENGRMQSTLEDARLNWPTLKLTVANSHWSEMQKVFGIAVTLYDRRSRLELYRTPLNYGRPCIFEVGAGNGSFIDTSIINTQSKVTVRNDTVTVQIPTNDCSQRQWIVKYDAELECVGWFQWCTTKYSTQVKPKYVHLPGWHDWTRDTGEHESSTWHSFNFDNLTAGATYEVRVRGQTLDGDWKSLYTKIFSVQGVNWLRFTVGCILMVTCLITVVATTMWCVCERRLKTHQRRRYDLQLKQGTTSVVNALKYEDLTEEVSNFQLSCTDFENGMNGSMSRKL